MPVRRRVGDRRIDAAIDHFVPMGFKKVDVRNIINSLLKNVYGKEGWPFLEENCYHVVQEALLEKQEEEEKLQLQVLQKKQHQEEEEEEEQHQQDDDEEEGQHVQEQQDEEWEDDDEDQQQEAAMMGAPSENDMPIVKVHNEVPSAVLPVGQTEEVVPMIIDPPGPKAALPYPAATRSGRTRRPCYGWISESESDSDLEEFLGSRQQQVHVPSPGGDLGKRKRPSRWDVKK